jgi:hypothetical protein
LEGPSIFLCKYSSGCIISSTTGFHFFPFCWEMIKVWRAVFARIYHHRLWKPLPTQPPLNQNIHSTVPQHSNITNFQHLSSIRVPPKNEAQFCTLYKNFALLDPDPDCEKYGSGSRDPIESGSITPLPVFYIINRRQFHIE